MIWRRSTAYVITYLLLGGCASTNPMVETPVTVTPKDNWFCDMGVENQTWECVKDYVPDGTKKRLSRSLPPKPDQTLPKTHEPEAVDSSDTVATRSPNFDIGPPLYRRLALKPGHAVNLIDLPPDYFAVQLFAVSNKEALEKFVRDKNVPGLSATRIAYGDQLFFVLLLGIYSDESAARIAAANMPSALNDLTPWVRRLGSLQDAMRLGDDLAGTPAI